MAYKRQNKENKSLQTNSSSVRNSDFVLDKVIFSNVFEKDIRRIYIYRKSERLAKAIHLITPAFGNSPSLRNRLDGIAVGLIDAAILAPSSAREALSRELLALSSLLSVARTGGLLSEMNADLITREAHNLLQEIAGYEEPRLFLDDVPSLAEFAKRAPDMRETSHVKIEQKEFAPVKQAPDKGHYKGHEKMAPKFTPSASDEKVRTRQESIITILRTKGPSYIKDISTMIRDVSEKTIQRELQALIAEGKITKSGDRRWTQYSILSSS